MQCCCNQFFKFKNEEEEQIKEFKDILYCDEQEQIFHTLRTESRDIYLKENKTVDNQTSYKNDKIRKKVVNQSLKAGESFQSNSQNQSKSSINDIENNFFQYFHYDDQSIVQNEDNDKPLICKIDLNIKEGHTQYELRQHFINRLEYNHIKTENIDSYTIFIYDWDDTFLCTSFLNRNSEDASSLKSKLHEITVLVEDILSASLELGRVQIVTNATTDWVWQSCHKWIPNVATLLRRVEIISARELYEDQQPNPSQWKTGAFKLLAMKHLNKDRLTNIVCMGDSNQEIESAVMMKNGLTNAFLKTIKLKENPHPIELYNQLEIVKNSLDMIVSKPKDLTIRLTKKD